MNDQRLYQIALCFVPQVGAVTAKTLLSYCGSAEEVFRAGRKSVLKIPGIGPVVADALQRPEVFDLAERELRLAEQHGLEILLYTDERYPARLRQNVDCPYLLFFKGSDAHFLNARRMAAIVGTRQPSDYGRMMCEELVEGLAAYDVAIVSGLAYGIDVVAHRKAAGLRMPNMAVLGHGLGSIYPGEHRSVALRILERGGLLSEYPFHTPPDREHFPMRNRIISGMCDFLLVVETAETGGSMISAELACQYEREVFAVPGRAKDGKSAGCNLLIKNEKARMAESVADIAQALRWDEIDRRPGIQTQLFAELSPDQAQVVELVRKFPEIQVDALAEASGKSPGLLAALILELEFKGLLRTLPGKRFVLNG
jgi:DNA processing protein